MFFMFRNLLHQSDGRCNVISHTPFLFQFLEKPSFCFCKPMWKIYCEWWVLHHPSKWQDVLSTDFQISYKTVGWCWRVTPECGRNLFPASTGGLSIYTWSNESVEKLLSREVYCMKLCRGQFDFTNKRSSGKKEQRCKDHTLQEEVQRASNGFFLIEEINKNDWCSVCRKSSEELKRPNLSWNQHKLEMVS